MWGLPSRTEVRTASTISSVRSLEIEKMENNVVDSEDVKILQKNEKNGSLKDSKNDSKNLKNENKVNEKSIEKSVGSSSNPLILSPVSEALRRSLCVNLRGLVKRLKAPQSSATALHALTLLHR